MPRSMTKAKTGPERMVVDEERQSADEQIEVDVLHEPGGSESEASEAAEGEAIEELEEYELEDDDDELQDSRTPSVAPTSARSPLKIKFKVRPGAAARPKRTRAAVQVESQDSEESESEDEMPQNVRLTKRQVALAKARKGIIASESSADEEEAPPNKRRRAALDPTTLALRKEESTLKRRNVSQKKLQNEKAETINRLLKKQSRTRNKRGSALATATTTPAEVPTPSGAPSEGMLSGSGSVGDGAEAAVDAAALAAPPAMFRWISTSRGPLTGCADAAAAPAMHLAFAVPRAFAVPPPPPPPVRDVSPAVCGVAGCSKHRRYRLVGGEWGTGACGMAHLKLLQGRCQ
ncbi:hypothetical protein GGX14DRAFT_697922 [Mycena pura]|uniref:INO80 complex subunit B-like conserved region domain-containing protein n=1 Tax=Mycena pura TaxID=153505 RepID=A0AAD6VC72_9AGAR|nr:hypothetical protein GGX14DRAFT_697922 [Mycena pura]